jgi:hypothetical protein
VGGVLPAAAGLGVLLAVPDFAGLDGVAFAVLAAAFAEGVFVALAALAGAAFAGVGLVGVAAVAEVDLAEVVLVDDVIAADDGLADVADRVDGVAAADAGPAAGVASAAGVAAADAGPAAGVASAAGVAATEADLAEAAALAEDGVAVEAGWPATWPWRVAVLADAPDRDGVAAAAAGVAEGVTSAAGVAAGDADFDDIAVRVDDEAARDVVLAAVEPVGVVAVSEVVLAAGAVDVVEDLVDDFAAAEVFLAGGVFAGSFSADLASADLASADLVSADLVSADLVSADLARVALGVAVGFGSGFAAEMRDVRAARVGGGLSGSASPSPVFVDVAALAATDSAAFRHAAGAGRPAPKVGNFPWDVISRLPSTRACA